MDNSGPYIETCQTWISLGLCAEEDRGEEYIVATGNMTANQKHTHANGAMYNADTMGYDPKHDLTGNFNYDCCVSVLLASLSCTGNQQSFQAFLTSSLTHNMTSTTDATDFNIEDFVVPSN